MVSEQNCRSRESIESTFREHLQHQRRDADHPGTREEPQHSAQQYFAPQFTAAQALPNQTELHDN